MSPHKLVLMGTALIVLGYGGWTLTEAIGFPIPPPDDDCRWISCAPCPDGYQFSPTEEDCCACVPLAES
jgi:hypothetical protein